MAISGDYVYLAERFGLWVVDISDPVSPYEVDFCDTLGYVGDLAVSGGYAYVLSDYPNLRVVDISDPSSPYEVGFYGTPGGGSRVAVSGGYIYVADGDSGLIILEFTGNTEVEEDISYSREMP